MAYIGRDRDYEEPLAQRSAMWTDLYELTMAQALFFEGRKWFQKVSTVQGRRAKDNLIVGNIRHDSTLR